MTYPNPIFNHSVLFKLTIPLCLVGCLSKPMRKIDLDQMPPMEMSSTDMGRPSEPIPCVQDSAPQPCGELSPDVQGVCAEALSYCSNGVWSSCDLDYLQNDSRFSSYLGEESLDCYDNDCDGSVDEDLNGVVPMSKWVIGTRERPSAHCHYRPFNDGAEVVNEVILVPEQMHYQMGSLTVHDGMTLKIKKNPELAEDELTPGYLPNIAIEGEPLGCMKGKVGGQLILSAEKIYIESGGALRADSESSYCVVDESVEQKSINGASGGELHLFARDLLIHGELSANGAPPQPQMFLMNEFYSTRMSGGAAGSIFLNSPNLVLKGEILTQGGSGRCEAIDSIESTECTNSHYSGGGPGREGGRPYNSNDGGGAGSGGRDYHSVNDNRTLGLIGLATGLEPTTSLRPADGNGICDGEIEYGPGTVHLFEGGTSCDSSLNSERASRLNHVRYRQVFIPLDEKGIPVASKSIYMTIINGAEVMVLSNHLSVGMIASTESFPSSDGYIISLSSDNGVDEDQIVNVKVLYFGEESFNEVKSLDVPIELNTQNGIVSRQGMYRYK